MSTLIANSKNDLIIVDILLKCSRNRGHACEKMRDKLVNLNGVTEAYLTSRKIGNVEYCVGGTAIYSKNNLSKLYTQIKNLKSKDNEKPITIKQLELLVPIRTN